MKDSTKSFEKVPINNVFLYSFTPSSFFLILERIQLLNRSTLCSIHLVLSAMQKSSALVHMALRILLLFVCDKSLGFCRLASYRISGLLSDAKVMLTSGNSVQDLTGVCHGVSSHISHSSVPAQSVHSAITSICADAQCTESKIEK